MDILASFRKKLATAHFLALPEGSKAVLSAIIQRVMTQRRVILLFLGGVLFGAIIKVLVAPYLTIGWDDYRLSDPDRLIRLNTLQETVLQSGGSLAFSSSETRSGERCINNSR